MNVSRRRFSGAVATGLVVIGAGCLDTILGDATEFEASPAEVDADEASEVGYTHEGTEADVHTEEFSVAGETQTVEVTNYVSQYHRSLDVAILDDSYAAVFAVIATPEVQVLGREFNPVGEWDDDEIVEHLQSEYEELRIDGSAGSRSVSSLGSTVDVSSYEGRAQVAGGIGVDVYVDIAKFEHGSDYVVTVGIYPQMLPDESENVDTLLENLVHEE